MMTPDIKHTDAYMPEGEFDRIGSPVGVVRMDTDRSYTDVGLLLQDYIDNSNPAAWYKIKDKIDYTFVNLDYARQALLQEADFEPKLFQRLEKGQKLLFKPNLVNPIVIDPQTYGPGTGATACTEWALVAALMRWFHEKLGISYYQMAVGEAASLIPALAVRFTRIAGKTITPEAVIEGKSGDFVGGWGFHFVRKYLNESPESLSEEDPWNGYEESLAGEYIPVGKAGGKLMVYDLNRIYDSPGKGREIPVPGGINFKTLTLHKVLVGGDPSDPDDLNRNPGCILVNVPKLKVHAMTLFTNILKNIGIGLYPMQAFKSESEEWAYAIPHKTVPGIKGGIPHQVWNVQINPISCMPKTEGGKPVITRTGGLTATMIDIIKAVSNQNIFMIHICDAIEAINIDHQGIGMGVKEKEGLVLAGLDIVATDLLSARYMFSNVSIKEAAETEMLDGYGGKFPQKVPIPAVEGKNIITRNGYDCPIGRDRVFAAAEERGLGSTKYSVIGYDTIADAPMVSLQGHLGYIKGDAFYDVLTKNLYFDAFCLPWDMQNTCLSYLASLDQLTGSSLKKEFLSYFDEDQDGVVTFEDFGKMGGHAIMLHLAGDYINTVALEEFGYLKGRFIFYSKLLKNTNPQWNNDGNNFLEHRRFDNICLAAFRMSTMNETPDLFVPDMLWGNGKWPSFEMAEFAYLGTMMFGNNFPYQISAVSMYGAAMFYADLTQNGGEYAGRIFPPPNPGAIMKYITNVSEGGARPLEFTFYVPSGFDILGTKIPNVEIAKSPAEFFTASFSGGEEIWPSQV